MKDFNFTASFQIKFDVHDDEEYLQFRDQYDIFMDDQEKHIIDYQKLTKYITFRTRVMFRNKTQDYYVKGDFK